tara:strand:- start:2227 stop:3366 length:1140 start_codon:yes stop_codon:yes gene_type:complete
MGLILRKRLIKINKEKLGRYGENPHQEAWIEMDESYKGPSILNKPLHGKPLSYNNLQDANAALEIMLDLKDKAAVVVLKHKNPCGLATGKELVSAFENAWYGDEISAFGSIVGFTQAVTLDVVKLLKGKFVEIILAPSFDKEALDWVESVPGKKNLRVIETGELNSSDFIEEYSIRGGRVSQTQDNKLFLCNDIEGLFNEPQTITEPNSEIVYQVGTVTNTKFNDSMKGLTEFSMVAGKHTRSNAIVLVYEYEEGQYRVLGMGAGQPNRIDAFRKLAFTKAKENLTRQYCRENGLDYDSFNGKISGEADDYGSKILGSERVVLFSDAFFPKTDSVITAFKLGVRHIVCPGGSIADDEVVKAADEKEVAMIFTGIRHFRH